jgi:hypothetical protein
MGVLRALRSGVPVVVAGALWLSRGAASAAPPAAPAPVTLTKPALTPAPPPTPSPTPIAFTTAAITATGSVADTTGSYSGKVTVTIAAPASPSNAYDGCTIGLDPSGNGNLTMPPSLPQALITGVQGHLPS